MKKLVIVGGGFAGAKIANKLQNRFKITLIDTKDYFEFTPGILRSMMNPNHLKKIDVCHSEYLKNSRIINDFMVGIKDKKVLLKRSKAVQFDYLIIASGSEYDSPIKAENIIIADRGQNIVKYHKKLENSKKIIIVGGGLVGVELAGEIVEKYKGKKSITIIHSGENLIVRNQIKSREYAEKFLMKKGVKIVFGERVKKNKSKERVVETDKKNNFPYDLVIMCTGIRPNSEFMNKNALDEKGFIKVNEFLQMNGRKDIFICGDIASIKEEKTAQGAEKQGAHVMENLKLLEGKKGLKPYHPRRRIMVISLGKWNGIFEWGSFVITGLIPAFMKWAIERKTMIRYRKL